MVHFFLFCFYYTSFMIRFEPLRCEKCREEIFDEHCLCKRCFEQVRELQLAERIEKKDYVIFSLFAYDGLIKELIRRMKFQDARYLAEVFASFIVRFVRENELPVSAVSYLPMHRLKKWVRGYDQAEDIASEVSKALMIPKVSLVRRVRYTKSLYRMTRLERRLQTSDMFEKCAELPQGFTMIIDDIVTSGSTIEACARALRTGSEMNFFFITVAKAMING